MGEWQTEEEFLKLADITENGKMSIQRSGCHKTGVAYVRILTGCLKDLPAGQLQAKIDNVSRMMVVATGREPMLDPHEPLWIQAEFLENLLDFERNPPCGCAPTPEFVAKESANG